MGITAYIDGTLHRYIIVILRTEELVLHDTVIENVLPIAQRSWAQSLVKYSP